jgi:hypothetical protein
VPIILLTSGTSWTVPTDWNNFNNTVEALGAGGNGGAGFGGGGGVYASKSNIFLPSGGTVAYRIGIKGGTTGSGISPTANTYFKDATTVVAAGGSSADDGVAGTVANSVGTVRFAGGTGWNGGGGAAGPHGAGKNAPSAGGASETDGGAGDNGNPAGGAAGTAASRPGGAGSNWTSNPGGVIAGAGGGGGTNIAGSNGNGGDYGAGGANNAGGGTAGLGSNGLIVITYVSATTIFLTAGTSWTVPGDFNPSSNTIEAIGGGGAGNDGSGSIGGQGGRGGGYSKISNFNPGVSSSIAYQIGLGGGTTGAGTTPTANTWFKDATTLVAPGDSASTTNSVGDVKFAGGGRGTIGGQPTGSGGGGAAGPNGAGVNGSNSGATNGGAGGAGDAGSGGAGGTVSAGGGNPGSAGAEFDATHGCGGGAAGGGNGSFNGGAGGNYGGAGGGGGITGLAGAGKNGIIIITYVPLVAGVQAPLDVLSLQPKIPPIPFSLRTAFDLPEFIPPPVAIASDSPQPKVQSVPIGLRTAFDIPERVPTAVVIPTDLFGAGFDPLPRVPYVPPALRTALGIVNGIGVLFPTAPTPDILADVGSPQPRAHYVPSALRDAFGTKVDFTPQILLTPDILAWAGGDPLPRVRWIHPHLKFSLGFSVGAGVLYPMPVTPARMASASGDPLPYAKLKGTPGRKLLTAINYSRVVTSLEPITRFPRKTIPYFKFVIMEEMVHHLNLLVVSINENLGRWGFLPSDYIGLTDRINPDQLAEGMNRVVREVNLRLKAGGLNDNQMILQFGQIDSSMCTLALNTFIDDLNTAFFYLFGS